MKKFDFTWKDIILEAPEDELETDDGLSATDYTEAEGLDIEEGEPSGDDETEEPTDTEDTELEDSMGEDDDPDDPLNQDPMGDSDTGDNPDDNPEDEQSNNVESDVTTDKQNINLVNDFIELYNRIDSIMTQIRTDCKTNIRYNPNMLVVRRNLTKLKEITYDYIINKFTKESYVSNLYQFNLIIQALNVNIDLLSSVLESNRKATSKEEKKKRKTKK